MRPERQPLLRPQRLQLGEREILAEPAVERISVDHLARAALGELRGHVGGAADLVLVPSHQHTVLRAHEVWLDEVGPHLHRQRVGGQRVLGAMTAGPAMGDHDRAGRGLTEQPCR
jgi:hypothetical protein